MAWFVLEAWPMLRAALWLLLLPGCLVSNSGGAILPARYDVGAASTHRGESATHYTAGLHWASVWPKAQTPVDVGVGWMWEQPNEPAVEGGPRPVLHGPYLELAYRVLGGAHQRTWLALRSEWLRVPVLGGDHEDGMGFTARAAWEVFSAGRGAGYCGAVGLGVFAEGSMRRLPGDRSAGVAIAGVSLRLPAVVVGK